MGAPLLDTQAGDGRPIAAHLSILLPSGDREAATVQGRAAAGRRGSVSDEPLSAATVLAVAICSLVTGGPPIIRAGRASGAYPPATYSSGQTRDG
jgi:hypothetical protein